MNKFKRIFKFSILIWIGILLIIILTACSAATTPETANPVFPNAITQESQPGPESEIEVPTAVNSEPTEEGYFAPEIDKNDQEAGVDGGYPIPEDSLQDIERDSAGYPSPEISAPPPLQTGLEATDPSTVNLSSGDLQLVEFFAFW